MSMMGGPQGRGEVGETVASYPTYEGAQKAVSALIAGDIPARQIAIVGLGLRSVERVTGRLGYANAARSGAINGLLLGLFFSAIFVLGNPAVPIQAFVGVLFVGIAIGMLLSIVAYSFVRRRRDYASVMQVIADHYEVTVAATSIHRARQILGTAAVPPAPHPRTVPAAPPAQPAPPARPAPPASPAPAADEPPRFGERLPAAGEPDAATAPEDPHATAPQRPAESGVPSSDDGERREDA